VIITAPEKLPENESFNTYVFLGGSIECGTVENWQDKLAIEAEKAGFIVLNPRRKEWDASLEQSLDNPQFVEQLEWEYNAQSLAHVLLYYFHENTKAPITLLELGHFINSGKEVIVICPTKYWRSGNVKFLCKKFDVPVYESLDDFWFGIGDL